MYQLITTFYAYCKDPLPHVRLYYLHNMLHVAYVMTVKFHDQIATENASPRKLDAMDVSCRFQL